MEDRHLLAKFSLLDIVSSPCSDLMAMCISKNIINNPNAVREDDLKTGDIIFYEAQHNLLGGKNG